MAIPFDCTYTHKYNGPELSSSPEAQLAFKASPTTLQHWLEDTYGDGSSLSCPRSMPGIAGERRPACYLSVWTITGHDLGPCPDPACFSDSLWTPAIHSIQQYGQDLTKSKSFLWLLLTLRTVHHILVEKEPMWVDVRLQAHEKFLKTEIATGTVFSSIIARRGLESFHECSLLSLEMPGLGKSCLYLHNNTYGYAILKQYLYILNTLTGPTQEIWSTTFRNHPKTLEASSWLTCLSILGTHISYRTSPYWKTQNFYGFCTALYLSIYTVSQCLQWPHPPELWRCIWWKREKRSLCFSLLQLSPKWPWRR